MYIVMSFSGSSDSRNKSWAMMTLATWSLTPLPKKMIVDFGLASLAGAADRRLAGTAGYLAPELLRGLAASPASDWFAVGVMLHEALTGQRPRLPIDPGPLVPDVPADLDRLCRDLLAADPEARPPGPEIDRGRTVRCTF